MVLNEERALCFSPREYPPEKRRRQTPDRDRRHDTARRGRQGRCGRDSVCSGAAAHVRPEAWHREARLYAGRGNRRGADRFDVTGFGADYAYTVDGGAIGELEYENFNAASAKIVIRGKSIHPGSAYGKMVNASARCDGVCRASSRTGDAVFYRRLRGLLPPDRHGGARRSGRSCTISSATMTARSLKTARPSCRRSAPRSTAATAPGLWNSRCATAITTCARKSSPACS